MMIAETRGSTRSGWVMLSLITILTLAWIGATVWLIFQASNKAQGRPTVLLSPLSITAAWIGWGFTAAILATLCCGFFTLQPNTAAVLVLFGDYRGTVRTDGFHWANPFLKKIKVSLRARNLNGDRLKVNDQRGNPIEIAAVVVWRVEDTAHAVFDVDDYAHYVSIQSESAVRHLASSYPYDTTADHELSLRGSMDEVSVALQKELEERLAKAGVRVEEARLSHLAYAPEIAGAMLRRQQAEAVVAARTRIVEGAVGMVQMALEHLERDKIVELDGERKAAMVSNLLVVLCGEQAAQPIVNTGTLYS
jgi:regulator of protease activity HflC (stomatin/prohibitin superfamily)